MDIQNILWNLDGTLFDTYPAITYAISTSLNSLGQSLPLNMIDGLVRHSLDYCLETLSLRFKLDLDILHLRFTESYLMVPLANQPPFPGVKEVCALIYQRGGQNVAVTHRSVESTHGLLDYHGLAYLFLGILSIEQGYPYKTDPSSFENAFQQYNIERAKTLVIGNRDLDIRAGREARVRTCLFGCEQHSLQADIQIIHFCQLLDLLKNDNIEN
jgi:phosphoglycolate phosphatase-like HAD superfamily hydrolase